MHGSTLIFVLIGVLLYLMMGALVFNALEAPNEEAHHDELQETRQEFLGNYTCVNPDNLSYLIDKVAEAISVGVDPNSNTTFSTSWDLASAFFFCGTIVTTIGYGNISPKTMWGQFFCICYTLVGIPLFGFLLAAAGDHLGTSLRNAIAKIEALLWKWKVSPTIVRVITAVLSILLGCVLFVFVPILVFQRVENWSLLESAYFVVITLTTVGFGDYVAGDGGDAGQDHWYKPLVWFWVLFGLAYFVSILSMIGNWILVLTKKTRAEMEGLRAHASDFTQNIQNMSVDFRIPQDPFKRSRRKRRHRRHRHNGSQGRTGEDGKEENESESGSYSGSSDESGSSSESESEVTQTERVPEGKGSDKGKDLEKEEKLHTMPKDTVLSQPLDYFGENLAYIDESSDAVSGKIHLDPLLDVPESNPASTDRPKRRRQRRHLRRDQQKPKTPKTSPNEPENKAPNGDIRQKESPTPKLI
ncbi:potassium channel subfamily K member 4 isoform X1 [Onychostoma macrolepis]|uniref:potassium channel subfamily K member 4 isoform X1 n=1 Tax=Onychostoma macrolepis TaxID=369639 RepID=UPI00272B4AC0|nr:potassium channel subfamily K member 4 isoform X1 [Onychostoma macrolepis]XP_058613523.1 potassium channel subfamily K member 4 isoform X1 [Onychostoma macrolepis]XP_058613524.1 potassium channel subfamily K member 4 isoform X1 [Onychostoma macrolepis]XP_058613525.1 potassium channel subfamily K member 4 isoform X1 [Onychostoma macrolepis]